MHPPASLEAEAETVEKEPTVAAAGEGDADADAGECSANPGVVAAKFRVQPCAEAQPGSFHLLVGNDAVSTGEGIALLQAENCPLVVAA